MPHWSCGARAESVFAGTVWVGTEINGKDFAHLAVIDVVLACRIETLGRGLQFGLAVRAPLRSIPLLDARLLLAHQPHATPGVEGLTTDK